MISSILNIQLVTALIQCVTAIALLLMALWMRRH